MISDIVGHILQGVIVKTIPGYTIILDEQGEILDTSADEDAAEDKD